MSLTPPVPNTPLMDSIQTLFQKHIHSQIDLADAHGTILAHMAEALANTLISGNKVLILSAAPFQSLGAYLETLLVYSNQRPPLPALNLKPELGLNQIKALAEPNDLVLMLGTHPQRDPQAYLKAFQEKSLHWIGLSAGEWHFPAVFLSHQSSLSLHLPQTNPLRNQEAFLIILHVLIESIEWQLFGASSFDAS